MLLGDLITAVTHDLPVKLVVFDNGRLGMVKLEMEQVGLPSSAPCCTTPTSRGSPRRSGMQGIRVTDPHAVDEAVREAMAHPGPVLLDVVTNPDEVAVPPKPTLEQGWGFAIAKSKESLESRSGPPPRDSSAVWRGLRPRRLLTNRGSGDPGLATSAGPASANTLASASSGEPAWRSATSRVVPGGPQPERVELLADREVARSRPASPSASAPAAVARWSRWPAVSRCPSRPEQLLGEVGLQALLEQREPGARADVGAERHPDAEREVGAEREQPAAERGVAGRAVRHRGPAPASSRSSASVGCTLWASTTRGPSSPCLS